MLEYDQKDFAEVLWPSNWINGLISKSKSLAFKPHVTVAKSFHTDVVLQSSDNETVGRGFFLIKKSRQPSALDT